MEKIILRLYNFSKIITRESSENEKFYKIEAILNITWMNNYNMLIQRFCDVPFPWTNGVCAEHQTRQNHFLDFPHTTQNSFKKSGSLMMIASTK